MSLAALGGYLAGIAAYLVPKAVIGAANAAVAADALPAVQSTLDALPM